MAKKKNTEIQPRKPAPGLKQKAIDGVKKIKIQPLPLVAALLSGIFNVIKLSPAGLVKDAEKVVGAVGLGTTPGELAQNLIVNALVRALADLLQEQRPFPESATPPNMERVRAAFKETISDGEIEIDSGFFKRPAALPLLEKIVAPLEGWLAANGASAPDARNIVRRLPSYFTCALHEEWSPTMKPAATVRWMAESTRPTGSAERARDTVAGFVPLVLCPPAALGTPTMMRPGPFVAERSAVS